VNTLEILKKEAAQEDPEAWEIVSRCIRCDPGIMDGLPVFAGTRVPVRVVLECLAEGMSTEEINLAFPTLEPEHIPAALKFSGLLAALH